MNENRKWGRNIQSFLFVTPIFNCYFLMCKGSPRVEGDEDEDDVDDIEHEFKMLDEKDKLKNEETRQRKKSSGDDDENAKSAEVSLFLI